MPTYEYQCEGCRRVFEVRQRISEPALTTCEACGGSVHRLLSAAPFILKGDGWHVTDYPSESRKKALEAEKPARSDDKVANAEKKPAETKGTATTATASSDSSAASPSG